MRPALFILVLLLGVTMTHKALADQDEIQCLSDMIYYESRGEGKEGMLAVSYVAINRSESGKYPKNLCDVVYQPCQFDGMKYVGKKKKDRNSWKKAREVATLSFYGLAKDPVRGAMYFHNTQVKPKWSYVLNRVRKINNHIFYR